MLGSAAETLLPKPNIPRPLQTTHAIHNPRPPAKGDHRGTAPIPTNPTYFRINTQPAVFRETCSRNRRPLAPTNNTMKHHNPRPPAKGGPIGGPRQHTTSPDLLPDQPTYQPRQLLPILLIRRRPNTRRIRDPTRLHPRRIRHQA